MMLKLLSPGDLVADWFGLPEGENRALFRMFLNTLIWGGIATGAALMIAF